MFKKNSQLRLLRNLILVTLSFFVILGLWKLAFSKVPDKTSEELCFLTNAARTELKYELGGKEIIGLPRGCKKIDKTIPEDLYDQNQKGAKEQLSNMVAKCWHMWLEGRDKNIMESQFVSSKNKCFICYQFYVNKKISFSAAEFDRELFEKTYIAQDTSDKCAGQLGGKCVDEAIKIDSGYKAVGKCGEKKVCVVHTKNECENKGGVCSSGIASGKVLYPEWKCEKGKTCYLDKKNVYTYYDYVQKFGGDGKIFVDKSDIGNFDATGAYAVTFIAKTDKFLVDALEGLKSLATQEDIQQEISSIYISRLRNVDGKCEVEAGVEAGVNE